MLAEIHDKWGDALRIFNDKDNQIVSLHSGTGAVRLSFLMTPEEARKMAHSLSLAAAEISVEVEDELA